MQGPNSILEKEFTANGALSKYTIAKKGTNEDDAAQASAATDPVIGVIQHDAADTTRVRLMLMGISQVVFGGTVTQGDFLVSDTNGNAISATRHTHTENTAGAYAQNATTGAASGQRSIGIAMCNGVSGDVGTVLLQPSFV